MIKKIKKGSRIFRVRLFSDNDRHPYTAKELGTPPHEYAKASRMSPAGIPLFYGALEQNTALQEVSIRKRMEDQYAVIAEFEVITDLDMLNLCDTQDVVSIFDLKKQPLRKATKFLREFAHEISKDITLAIEA